MRASSAVATILLVTLGAIVMPGCGSGPRDPVRPIEHSASTVSVQASVPDCVAPDSVPDPNAPVVQILYPSQNPAFGLNVPTTFTVTWSGSDADGRIREYRFRLFGSHNPDFPEITDFVSHVLINPRVLEDYYGPCFEKWDSAPPNVISHTYQGLTPGLKFLFVVTAIDNDGKHDSDFGFPKNLLVASAVDPQSLGPLLSFASGSWTYTYPNGGYINDPSRYVDLAVLAGEPVTVQWAAQPLGATPLEGYRWGLDLTDLEREGPRGSGAPPGRWSGRRLDNTSAMVGPFGAGETHLLFVDVTDKVGLASLGIIRLNVAAGGVRSVALRRSRGPR